MTTIHPQSGPIIVIRVQGLCYESTSVLTSEVQACGFDYLTVQYSPENTRGDIAFTSMDELTAIAKGKQLDTILTALNWQAQQDADQWTKDKASLRAYLRRS